jgi:hypothetical protein
VIVALKDFGLCMEVARSPRAVRIVLIKAKFQSFAELDLLSIEIAEGSRDRKVNKASAVLHEIDVETFHS